jgi:hypothetical protein
MAQRLQQCTRAMMRMILVCFLAVFLTGCTWPDPMPEWVAWVQRAEDHHEPMYFCWFVERDPAGHHGYSYNRGGLSHQPPGGRGFFKTIGELRQELYADHFTKITFKPDYPRSVPSGWVIRALTEEEAKSLQ